MKKCSKCGVPLEGILYKISGKLFGVKESDEHGVCNRCKSKEADKGKGGAVEENVAQESTEEAGGDNEINID